MDLVGICMDVVGMDVVGMDVVGICICIYICICNLGAYIENKLHGIGIYIDAIVYDIAGHIDIGA